MRALILSAGLLVAVSGCVVERDYASERSDFSSRFENQNDVGWTENPDFVEPPPEEDFYGTLPITTGRVRGDIGGVTNFDAPTDYVDSWGDEAWASVTLNATDDQGRVGMIILEVVNMDIMNDPAGTYTTQNVDGGEIYVTGCSSDNDSFYDAPAEQGTVVIQDNDDGTRDVEIQATLPGDSGSTEASARFTLE